VQIGIFLRLMGPQSTRDTLVECARTAEALGFADLWVPDHISIPPDDAEGSGGRYLDALASLAYLAGVTSRIGLATGALVLPYRPALPTAKWIASIQELSGGRLALGVGAGWMESEFRALGVPRARRGRITDETLAFLHACFESDEVERNGQRFLFLPRPARPRIYIVGSGEHALARTLRCGDGWMPMIGSPEKLSAPARELRERAAALGRPAPEIIAFTALTAADPSRTADRIAALREAGATRLVHASRYADAEDFRRQAEWIAEHAPRG
jgi:probable F420-dependent oxidoreductase